MLIRFDPFREIDRVAEQAFGMGRRQTAMPMDAYRDGDHFVVHLDLPGVDPGSIDLMVEKNVLTVSAQRSWEAGDSVEVVATERPQGSFSRQLFLGDSLDAERISARYDNGVLTITIPVAEQARPRKVEINSGASRPEAIETTSTTSKSSAATETNGKIAAPIG